MKAYLDIVEKVLATGKWKKPVRRNADGSEVVLPHDTLALANQVFTHNMSDGFPLLTTKRMPIQTILIELEGFLKGITSKRWYQERGCKIWNEWANPKQVDQRMIEWQNDHASEYSTGKELVEASAKLRLQFQADEDDLGPIYGYQWRHFGSQYGEVERDKPYTSVYTEHYEFAESLNGLVNGGTDQLKTIVDTLRKNPYDRRMVCSAWNPNQISQMALPPCHYAWNVTVIGDEINLFWAQRSCDLMLGVPFNIASYASLLLLLAKESGFKPGSLTGVLVDCHIYANQIPSAKEQITREPRSLPQLDILDKPDESFSIFDWTYAEHVLHNYNPHKKLSFGEVTV